MYSFSNASSPSRSDSGESSSGRYSYASWDPADVLQIYNEAYGGALTCVGCARTKGRRCQILISGSNEARAESILEDLAGLDPNSTGIKPLLQRLAECALCPRWHRNQVDEVTRNWLTALANHSRRHGAYGIPKFEPTVKTEPGQHTVPDPSATINAEALRTIQELMASLKAVQADLQAALAREAEERRAKEQLQAKMAKEAVERREKEEREAAAARLAEESREKEKRQKHVEKQRREREEAERRRKAAEEAERQRLEAEQRRERERKQREEQEKLRREAEKLQKQRSEQEQAWKSYNLAWEEFDELKKEGRATIKGLRWPVKFGTEVSTTESAVREFYRIALEGKTALEKKKLMKREMFRWHPDRLSALQPRGVVKGMIDMVARVVLDFRFE